MTSYVTLCYIAEAFQFSHLPCPRSVRRRRHVRHEQARVERDGSLRVGVDAPDALQERAELMHARSVELLGNLIIPNYFGTGPNAFGVVVVRLASTRTVVTYGRLPARESSRALKVCRTARHNMQMWASTWEKNERL